MAGASNDLPKLNSTKNILRSLAGRLQAELALKLVLLAGLNLWVYGPYLFLQRHHFFPTTNMSPGVFDRWIPFSDHAVWLYFSIYLLMPVGPFLMNDRKQILRYAVGIALISLLANFTFLFWPTICKRPDVEETNAAYQTLTTLDNSFHALPSLHAAFAIYSAQCGSLVLRGLGSRRFWRIGLWLWAILILWATLATKQHVVVDIIAGSALGLGIYRCVFSQRFFIFKSPPALHPAATNQNQPASNIP